jgi:hypothetical protein
VDTWGKWTLFLSYGYKHCNKQELPALFGSDEKEGGGGCINITARENFKVGKDILK